MLRAGKLAPGVRLRRGTGEATISAAALLKQLHAPRPARTQPRRPVRLTPKRPGAAPPDSQEDLSRALEALSESSRAEEPTSVEGRSTKDNRDRP